jgi:hypothetical protein
MPLPEKKNKIETEKTEAIRSISEKNGAIK